MKSDFNYDGRIKFIGASYEAFASVSDNESLYCIDEDTGKLLLEGLDSDWFIYNPENSVSIYFNNQVRSVADFEKVRAIGFKTQKYAALLFLKDEYNEEGEDRKTVYLNLINVETGQPLHFCPELKTNVTDYKMLGIANPTPLTAVFLMGYTDRFLAFYTSPYTRWSEKKDYQLLCTDITNVNDTEVKSYIADMQGTFTEDIQTTKYVRPVISKDTIPFKGLNVHIIPRNVNDIYISVGDVFNAFQDTNRRAAKITYKEVDYIKYAYHSINSVMLWFRVYGGSNGL